MKNTRVAWIASAVVLLGLCLSRSARADLIQYTVAGSSADWSGVFEVVDADLEVRSWAFPPDSNLVGVDADALSQVSVFYFGSNLQGWLSWSNFSGQGLSLQSPEMYAIVSAGATWNSLIGQSFDITSTDFLTRFVHPDQTLEGSGGTIAFSAVGIPEPQSVLMLIAALGSLAGYRRFRRAL